MFRRHRLPGFSVCVYVWPYDVASVSAFSVQCLSMKARLLQRSAEASSWKATSLQLQAQQKDCQQKLAQVEQHRDQLARRLQHLLLAHRRQEDICFDLQSQVRWGEFDLSLRQRGAVPRASIGSLSPSSYSVMCGFIWWSLLGGFFGRVPVYTLSPACVCCPSRVDLRILFEACVILTLSGGLGFRFSLLTQMQAPKLTEGQQLWPNVRNSLLVSP